MSLSAHEAMPGPRAERADEPERHAHIRPAARGELPVQVINEHAVRHHQQPRQRQDRKLVHAAHGGVTGASPGTCAWPQSPAGRASDRTAAPFQNRPGTPTPSPTGRPRRVLQRHLPGKASTAGPGSAPVRADARLHRRRDRRSRGRRWLGCAARDRGRCPLPLCHASGGASWPNCRRARRRAVGTPVTLHSVAEQGPLGQRIEVPGAATVRA